MRKTALAVALGSVFVAPAAHAQIVFGNEQIGTVQIYGRLYPQLQWSKTDGASKAGTRVSTMAATSGTLAADGINQGTHFGVQTSNSRLGFRGERAFGKSGLKGIWQLEQTVNFEDPDDVANNCDVAPASAGDPPSCAATGGVSATDNIFSTRNSFVGLTGGFGTVKLGHMDTIYKEYGDTLNMFGVKSGNFVSASNMLSHIGIGTNGLARFHERAPNSIMYETPQIAGFTAGIQYMPDERHGDTSVTVNKRLSSYGIKFDRGPIYVSLAHEIHRDFFGLSRNVSNGLRNRFRNDGTGDDPHSASKDTATRLNVTWRVVSGHEIVVDVARLKWSETRTATATQRIAEYKKPTWAIGWEGRFPGGIRGAAQYVYAGDGSCKFQGTAVTTDCTTEGLKSNMISLAAGYDLDRQTRLYALANWTKNGASARYDSTSLLSPDRGADITNYALGISYTF